LREEDFGFAECPELACTTVNLVLTRAHGGRDLGIPGRLLPDHHAHGRTDLGPEPEMFPDN
jgi:hypothetical protein